jgi:hypothetical protein
MNDQDAQKLVHTTFGKLNTKLSADQGKDLSVDSVVESHGTTNEGLTAISKEDDSVDEADDSVDEGR